MRQEADPKPDEKSETPVYMAFELIGLAEERTFTSWMRMGLTMIGVGLAAAKLLPATPYDWLARLLGSILVVAGGGAFVIGFRTYHRSLEQLLEKGYDLTPLWAVGGVTAALVLAAVVALFLVFI